MNTKQENMKEIHMYTYSETEKKTKTNYTILKESS